MPRISLEMEMNRDGNMSRRVQAALKSAHLGVKPH